MPVAPARHAPARRTPPARRPAPVRRRGTAAKPAPKPAPKRTLPRGAAVLDALLHGRAWIALVFVLLAGIVFFNVDLLRMNNEIAATTTAAGEMKRDNARLRALTARLGSSERIQAVAAQAGLVLPAPGEVRYLRSNPSVDGASAARRLEEDPGVAAAPGIPEPVPTDAGSEPVADEVAPTIDPVTGAPVAPSASAPVATPVQAAPVDPTTGVSIDPATGAPIDPATGAPAG